MIAHLKDKDKIRHKKRWSQVKHVVVLWFLSSSSSFSHLLRGWVKTGDQRFCSRQMRKYLCLPRRRQFLGRRQLSIPALRQTISKSLESKSVSLSI
jgi:hypothetical protein